MVHMYTAAMALLSEHVTCLLSAMVLFASFDRIRVTCTSCRAGPEHHVSADVDTATVGQPGHQAHGQT